MLVHADICSTTGFRGTIFNTDYSKYGCGNSLIIDLKTFQQLLLRLREFPESKVGAGEQRLLGCDFAKWRSATPINDMCGKCAFQVCAGHPWGPPSHYEKPGTLELWRWVSKVLWLVTSPNAVLLFKTKT